MKQHSIYLSGELKGNADPCGQRVTVVSICVYYGGRKAAPEEISHLLADVMIGGDRVRLLLSVDRILDVS